MTIELRCSDLGIRDCSWVARGETAGDVVEQVVRHLRREQDINMPNPEQIIEGQVYDDPMDTLDPAVATLVERLREELNLGGTRGTPDVGPLTGRAKSG
jgi:predicted small metal-binding protein